jgi:hypothetical protein
VSYIDIVGKTQTKNKIAATFILLTFLLFPLITHELASANSSTQWDLPITTLSGATITFNYNDLLAMPKTMVSADLSCYGNLIASGTWGGVKLADILNQAGIDPSATNIDFMAEDGYSVSIPINTAMRSDIIVAYDMDGAPLTEVLRLVVPEANGNIWIARITSISIGISPVVQVQSGTSGQSIIDQYRAIINLTTPKPQLQLSVETQPAIPSNETTVEPQTTPTNVTIQLSEQKVDGQENIIFPFVYVLVLLTVVVVVVASFVFYCRKKKHST